MRCIAGWGLGWAAFGWAGCSGEPPVERPDLEVCDDGIDNDGDGQVDCDDVGDCGGLACRDTNVGDDDDDTEPPMVEIVFDETECCSFDFAPSDCPQKEIGTFRVTNRMEDEDALLDVFCDRIGPNSEPVIQWKSEGSNQARPTVANATIAPGTSATMVGVFVCAAGVTQTFTSECNIFVEAVESSEEDELVFTIEATTVSR
jgi:hypothetical protein